MSAHNVFGLFQQLADRGTPVVVVTHDRELVRNIPKLYELADCAIGATTLEATARRRTAELRATRTKIATRGR